MTEAKKELSRKLSLYLGVVNKIHRSPDLEALKLEKGRRDRAVLGHTYPECRYDCCKMYPYDILQHRQVIVRKVVETDILDILTACEFGKDYRRHSLWQFCR